MRDRDSSGAVRPISIFPSRGETRLPKAEQRRDYQLHAKSEHHRIAGQALDEYVRKPGEAAGEDNCGQQAERRAVALDAGIVLQNARPMPKSSPDRSAEMRCRGPVKRPARQPGQVQARYRPSPRQQEQAAYGDGELQGSHQFLPAHKSAFAKCATSDDMRRKAGSPVTQADGYPFGSARAPSAPPEKASRPTPVQRKPPWIRVKAPGSPAYGRRRSCARTACTRSVRRRLPEHRRVLGKAARNHDDYGRHLHARLRFLQCEDGPARARSIRRSRSMLRRRLQRLASPTWSSPRWIATTSPMAVPAISPPPSARSAPPRPAPPSRC